MEDKIDKILQGIAVLDEKSNATNIKLEEFTKQISVLQQENADMKRTILKLETKLDYLENQTRRNNLVIYGIPEDTEDNESWDDARQKIIEVITQFYGLKLNNWDIERAHRLGFNKKPNICRPIIAKFLNFQVKDQLIRNGVKLKGSNIAVSEDFSEKVKQERILLKPYLTAAKDLGARAHLNFNKLSINGKYYRIDDLYKAEIKKPQDIGIIIKSSRRPQRELPHPIVPGVETRRQAEARQNK